MDMIQINALNHFLREGIVEVNFEKSDGTLRKMNCTLVPEYMRVEYSEDNKAILNFSLILLHN